MTTLIPVTARQITSSSAPFVITEPGHYLLVEDVTWTARDATARAITIASDHVTLDLGGRTLWQGNTPPPVVVPAPEPRLRPGRVVSGNVGIWAEGQRDITIQNGTVGHIQGVGIAVKDCHQVDLQHLSTRNCGGNGVVDTSFLYRNGGIFVMGTRDAHDHIAFASHIRLHNCVCTHNTSQLDFVVTLGALVLFCEQVKVTQCVFTRTANASSQPSGVPFNVVGSDFVICRHVLVEDCEAHDNTSGGEAAGFFAWGEHYTFRRCRAHRNGTRTGNYACGFNISTTTHLAMIDCEAHGNYNTNPQASRAVLKDFSAAGYRLGRAVSRGRLENCRAVGNYSLGRNAPASGFMLNDTCHIVLQDCVACGNWNASGTEANHVCATGVTAVPHRSPCAESDT